MALIKSERIDHIPPQADISKTASLQANRGRENTFDTNQLSEIMTFQHYWNCNKENLARRNSYHSTSD